MIPFIAKLLNQPEPKKQGFWQHHRFLFLIIGTIVIAIGLVAIGLSMYNSSGAALLDFSRPQLQSVRDQVDRGDAIQTFSANGSLDVKVVDEFSEEYTTQAERAQSVDAFGADPLNPETLLFGSTTPTD